MTHKFKVGDYVKSIVPALSMLVGIVVKTTENYIYIIFHDGQFVVGDINHPWKQDPKFYEIDQEYTNQKEMKKLLGVD